MITILGPTACGKTTFATQLAYKIGAEIISADSRQVYRGMDLGTGKDLEDYVIDGSPIPYHLIDIAEAGEKYNVYRFQKDFRAVLYLLCDVRAEKYGFGKAASPGMHHSFAVFHSAGA